VFRSEDFVFQSEDFLFRSEDFIGCPTYRFPSYSVQRLSFSGVVESGFPEECNTRHVTLVAIRLMPVNRLLSLFDHLVGPLVAFAAGADLPFQWRQPGSAIPMDANQREPVTFVPVELPNCLYHANKPLIVHVEYPVAPRDL